MRCFWWDFFRGRRIRGDSGVPEFKPQICDDDYGTGAETAPAVFSRYGIPGAACRSFAGADASR